MRLRLLIASVSLAIASLSSHAQFAGPALHDNFVDTSVLRPPAGSKVALMVFEDLGCPACARWHPTELDVIAKTHVTFARHDYPLPQHIWTFDGAVFARYLQDKVNPALAAQYRTDVFHDQMQIGSKDDLRAYNQRWMQQHGQKMPTAVDPDGSLTAKVKADVDLGNRLHIEYTPTIVVVTNKAYQVVAGTAAGSKKPEELLEIVKAAQASVASTPTRSAAKSPAKKK